MIPPLPIPSLWPILHQPYCDIHDHGIGSDHINRGSAGEEIVDENFTFANPRRRSNSTGYANQLRDFKTKFDVNDEPVFEETLHGPSDDDGDELAKTETSDSGRSEEDDKNNLKQ